MICFGLAKTLTRNWTYNPEAICNAECAMVGKGHRGAGCRALVGVCEHGIEACLPDQRETVSLHSSTIPLDRGSLIELPQPR